MHACLLHVYARALLYLFIYLMLIIMGIGHGFVHVHLCSTKTDRRHAYVIHSAMLLFLLQAPEWFQFIGR
jgi:hypothetical protein